MARRGDVIGGIAIDVNVADATLPQNEKAGISEAGAIRALAFVGDEGFVTFFKDPLDVDGEAGADRPAIAEIALAIHSVIHWAAEAEVGSKQIFDNVSVAVLVGRKIQANEADGFR